MTNNTYTETHCEVCGERFKDRDEVAEMYNPDGDEGSLIVHAQCGLNKGMEVA
jgi:hypothetical protein